MVGGNHSGTYSIGHFHFLKHLQVPLLSSQVGWMWLDVKIVIKTEGWPIRFSKPPLAYLHFNKNVTFLSFESVFIDALTKDGL